MKIRWKHWLYPLAVLVIGGAIGFYMVSNRSSSVDFSAGSAPVDPLADAPTVSMLAPTLQDYAPQLRLYGQFRSTQQVVINSPSSADVVAVLVNEGDVVSVGQTLVQLDSKRLMRQANQLRSQRDNLLASWAIDEQQHASNIESLQVEQNLVSISQRSVNRLSDLRARNLSSDSELESVERALQNQLLSQQSRQLAVDRFQFVERQYQAQLAELDSKIEDATEQLGKATVVAPFAGVVSQVEAQVGETPAAGSPLLTLVDQGTQELVAWAAVSALDAASPSAQLRGFVQVNGFDVRVRLAHTDPAAQSGSLRLFFNIEGRTRPMILNRYYPLYVNLPPVAAFAVPEESVYSNRYVYVIEANALVRVPVTVVGERFENGRLLRLVQGDLAQTNVLTTRLQNVAQGLLVRTQNASIQPTSIQPSSTQPAEQ